MTIVAAAGFFGYTLCNVLFLTASGNTSVLEAGLALTPGPFMAAAVAGPASRLAERFGPPRGARGRRRSCGAPGCSGSSRRSGPTPDFVGEWLPGMVIMGIGAGITFPNLSGAAVASAPGETFATATGLNSVARQIGAAFGVAIVVVIIGQPTTVFAATSAFDSAWLFSAICLFVTGVGCLLVGRVGPGDDVSRSPRSRTRRARAGGARSRGCR